MIIKCVVGGVVLVWPAELNNTHNCVQRKRTSNKNEAKKNILSLSLIIFELQQLISEYKEEETQKERKREKVTDTK